MVFHETTLYNEKSGGSTDTTNTTFKNPEFVSLDIFEFTPHNQVVDMRILVVLEDGAGPSTPPTILHKSTRSIRAPDRYSPSLD